MTGKILALFCDEASYTLGNFGQVWANWHAIGCAFVGMTNLSVALDDGSGFGIPGRRAVARNTAFIFGVWGVQNTWYCVARQDLFTPAMWLNAAGCIGTALASVQSALRPASDRRRK